MRKVFIAVAVVGCGVAGYLLWRWGPRRVPLAVWVLFAAVGWQTSMRLRARRRIRRLRAQIEETRGKAEALRLEASLSLWDDARLESLHAEMASVAGPEEAEKLRSEVTAWRAAAHWWVRPARGWRVLVFSAAWLVVVAFLVAIAVQG